MGKKNIEFKSGTIKYSVTPVHGMVVSYNKQEVDIDKEIEKIEKLEKEDAKKELFNARIKSLIAKYEKEYKSDKPAGRRFSVIGGQPVPDPEGEYTFAEALAIAANQKGQEMGVSGEKVSEILNSIMPFVNAQIEKAKDSESAKQQASLAMEIFKAFVERERESSSANVPQQFITFKDLMDFVTKVDEMRKQGSASSPSNGRVSVFGELSEAAKALKEIRELFGGTSQPVYITIPGPDGRMGAIDYNVFERMQDKAWQREKEQREFENKMKTGEDIRRLIRDAARAFTSMAGPTEGESGG